MDFEQIVGPFGALAVLVAAAGVLLRVAKLLWDNHLAADERERATSSTILAREQARTADATARLDRALTGLEDHTNVTDKAVALAQQVVNQLQRGAGNGQ